jgi:hypothetical protein
MAFILIAGSAQNFNLSAAAVTLPAVPGSFTAARASGTSIKLSWKAASGAIGYVLYRYSSTTKTYNRLKVTAALSYTNTGLVTNTTYSYKVRAYRTFNGTNYYGNPSAAATATTTAAELLGVAPDRLVFIKKVLNLWDKSKMVEKAVSRKTIINYGKTGEGLQVVNYDNGTPALAVINFNSVLTGYLNTCVSDMKKYDANYLKEITANGAVAIMADGQGTGGFTYNKYGLIDWRLSSANYNNVNALDLEQGILVESLGIRMENLGGDYLKYEGFLKEGLASDCWWNLYKKNGSYICKGSSFHHYLMAKEGYGDFYAPVTFKDKKIQDLLKNVRSKNLASAFGGTWSEISASIVDRPDWKSGDTP